MNKEEMIERLLRHDGCGVRRVNNYGLGNYSATVLDGGGSGGTTESAVRKAVQSELSIRAGSVIRLSNELKGVKERLEESSAVCRDIGFGDEVEKAERLISDELNEVEITIKRKPDGESSQDGCSETADKMRDAASGVDPSKRDKLRSIVEFEVGNHPENPAAFRRAAELFETKRFASATMSGSNIKMEFVELDPKYPSDAKRIAIKAETERHKQAMDEHIADGKLGVHDPDDTARLCLEKLNDEITGRTHELNRQIEALQLRDQPVPSGLWESKEEVRKLCIKTGRYVSHVRACERAKVV